jgi:hypothetical protein
MSPVDATTTLREAFLVITFKISDPDKSEGDFPEQRFLDTLDSSVLNVDKAILKFPTDLEIRPRCRRIKLYSGRVSFWALVKFPASPSIAISVTRPIFESGF